MNLAISVGTTGLFDENAPNDAPHQPKIVRLAALLYDDREYGLLDLLIRPDGWKIPQETKKFHGTDERTAMMAGIPLRVALSCLTNLSKAAHKVAGFSIDYDIRVIQSALFQFDRTVQFPRPGCERIDIKQPMTPVCRLTRKNPKHEEDFRWPKLAEAHAIAFGVSHVAGDLLADVRAIVALHNFLTEKGLLE